MIVYSFKIQNYFINNPVDSITQSLYQLSIFTSEDIIQEIIFNKESWCIIIEENI